MSEDVKGAQIAGIYNRGRHVSGMQIGLVNVADSLEDGVALGLVNISKDGLVQPAIEHNDVIDATFAFRSGNEKLYTILFAGRDEGDDYLWSYGLGLGTQFNMKSKFVTNFEITTQQLNPEGQHSDYINILNRVSLNFGFRFARHLNVAAGPAFNIYVTDDVSHSSDVHGHDIGRSIIYNEIYDCTNVRMWFGYNAAIKF